MAEQTTDFNDITVETIEAKTSITAPTLTITTLSATNLTAQTVDATTSFTTPSGTITTLSATNAVFASSLESLTNATTSSEVPNLGQFPNTGDSAYQGLPNGFKIQSGVTTTAATSGTVTFTTAYTNVPMVTVAPAGAVFTFAALDTVTVSAFTYAASAATNISWHAVGI